MATGTNSATILELFAGLLIFGAGFAMIIGRRRFGFTLFVSAMALLVTAALRQHVMSQLPSWLVAPVAIAFALVTAVTLLRFLVNREAYGHVVGTYLVRLIDLIFLGPFRLLAWLFRRRRG